MKRIKKAQAGREIVTERKLMPSWTSSNVKGMRGSSGVVDTVARRAAIKRGEFREDPKTGDIYPTKRYYAAKKAQNGKDTTVVATWKRTIGDTAAQKKKADSLGLSTDKAKEALKARIAAKKKQRSGGKTPAWQRKEGKSPSGGLNAKGRASLRAAGHDIKAPQPQGGPRKRSFCARMSGMKKKLTSAKTANDPNSRINKSLRKWKC